MTLSLTHCRRPLCRMLPLLLFCMGAATSLLSAGEGDDTHPLDLARKLREGGVLTEKEEAYVDRLRRTRGLTRTEAAEHIESTWETLEKTQGEEAYTENRPRRDRPLESAPQRDTGSAWVVGVALALGVLFAILVLWLRHWWQERRIERSLRDGRLAGDLLRTQLPERDGDDDFE